ncbi:MAG: glycine cleavage system protein GcvH [Marinilabiliales bacterium]|nr:MAG: glycine cleavage system protein GcvH [Marinilabiliales bacterium]
MEIPVELKYTKDHEWVKVENGVAVVGITEFAQGELGDIVFIEIETQGDTLDKDEVFGTIEAVKTVSDMFMPVSGEVDEVNSKLAETPDIINKDPYGEGWMIRIRMSDPSQVDSLLTADQYRGLIDA